MSSLDSVNGPSVTVTLPPARATRAPAALGSSPAVSSSTPASVASPPSFMIASNSSGGGGVDGLVPDSSIMYRMVLLPVLVVFLLYIRLMSAAAGPRGATVQVDRGHCDPGPGEEHAGVERQHDR